MVLLLPNLAFTDAELLCAGKIGFLFGFTIAAVGGCIKFTTLAEPDLKTEGTEVLG